MHNILGYGPNTLWPKAHNALNIGLWAQYIVAKALCYNKLTLCVCVWVQYIVAKALCYKIFSRHCLCVFGCNTLWPKRCVISYRCVCVFLCNTLWPKRCVIGAGWHLLHGNNTLLLTISMATTYCCQHSNNTLGITHIHHHYHPHTSSLAPTPIHTHSSTDTNRHPAGTPKPQNHWGHTAHTAHNHCAGGSGGPPLINISTITSSPAITSSPSSPSILNIHHGQS